MISIIYPLYADYQKKSRDAALLVNHDRKAFDHALNDAILWGQFKEHVAQDLCVENCLFHDEVFFHIEH
jgi:hypothetical protein